jgi:hypothetical protein
VTVSLLEILAAARAHVAPLAAESAGYLLLAVADHVALAPRAVSAEDVELLQDGTVRLRPRRSAGEDTSVERGVRALLARALSVSSSVGPALRRASERRDQAGLPGLVRELENALIPVNRAAAKRALSRLYRETDRARAAGKLGAGLQAEAAREAAAPVSAEPPRVVVEPPRVAPAPPVVEELLVAAEFPDPSPVALPVVEKAPTPPPRAAAPRVVAPAPLPVLTLTPEPQIAVGEPAFTKPEPVVLRKRERGSRTPRLGTLITAQTLPGEESELTERAPAVVNDEELEIEVDVVVEEEVVAAPHVAAPQPLLDPEPSRMPDVIMAMVELHTGVDADEAPTRLRDVVTAVAATPAPVVVESVPAPVVVESVPAPVVVESVPAPVVVESVPAPVVAAEPVVQLFVSELADSAVHDALTWNPGPVAPVANSDVVSSLPAALLIAEPAPEPSPYAPAVLPARSSDVSELLDSFYVSGAAEEHELRSALKEMAGLSLTPMPVPLIEEG